MSHMVKASLLATAGVCLSLLVGSCQALGITKACTDEARAGIRLSLMELGGSPLETDGVTVTVTDGSFAESRVVPGDRADVPVLLAFERAGTYSITVTADGYDVWTSEGVRVTREDSCHVATTSVEAALSPR